MGKLKQLAEAAADFYQVPFEKLMKVNADEDLAHVMKLLTEEEINQLPVIEGDNIIGMISRENMLAFINLRDKLGM